MNNSATRIRKPRASVPPAVDLAALRRGDTRAQRHCFERWYAYALTVMLHYAPTRPLAEEMTMDAFERLFRKIHQFDEQRNFRPWFRRLLVNVATDALRRRRPQFTEWSPDLGNGFDENEALPALERTDAIALLQQLPDGYRLVFNLFVLEDYTHREIAEELNISVGTSKSNLAAARRKLRELLPLHYAIAKPKS